VGKPGKGLSSYDSREKADGKMNFCCSVFAMKVVQRDCRLVPILGKKMFISVSERRF